ncbi:twin-arginine translocase TatA/TatE family subunit [Acetobacter sp. AN02]|uniref:twin-arginine translocase TatA/TatE family subunit n=1 Tax=Acetobacter sp. AN02 TaxID=2894186 RepID=UPI002434605D|nr:twin-arginine translocase TatA/TatE family subunit [Acetobacter sp. AN02]MDG6094824.1 twin-arginine translocase TatA/TatE family subunit [Acetobacter sp. AN02]
MGGLSIWHWLIVLAVVLVVFGGGGKISSLMGDMGKGLKSFKKNLQDDESMSDDELPSKDGRIPPPGAEATADVRASARQTDQAPRV